MEKEICQADLLIIDDVHMVSGSKAPKVTEILMKLFDTFSAGNTQKAGGACLRPSPSQMTSFGERYISRLSSCLQLSIEPPDMEMRIQILEKKRRCSICYYPENVRYIWHKIYRLMCVV